MNEGQPHFIHLRRPKGERLLKVTLIPVPKKEGNFGKRISITKNGPNEVFVFC